MSLNRVKKIDHKIKVNNVIISVFDKNKIGYLVTNLIKINPDVNIFSTGGSYNKIKEILKEDSEKHLIKMSDYTGQPEMQGGLVKTLDFKIYLGILNETYNSDHKNDIERVKGLVFDMVVVNLYPFTDIIKQTDITLEDARTNIDIGGPCMLRASGKNFLRVLSVCDPEDYDPIINELNKNSGEVSLETRFKCAKKSFSHTAEYDNKISVYLQKQSDNFEIYDFQK